MLATNLFSAALFHLTLLTACIVFLQVSGSDAAGQASGASKKDTVCPLCIALRYVLAR
jgi:hypothetical protein